MFLSDQRTDYLEIHWFQYISQILSPKMEPQIGHFFKMLKIGQLLARFWDLKFVNYMETNVLLGTLCHELKGTSFLLM